MKRRNWEARIRRESAKSLLLICGVVFGALIALFLVYFSILKDIFGLFDSINGSKMSSFQLEKEPPLRGGYNLWRKIAVDLAELPVDQVLEKLLNEDPFGMRSFSKALIKAEEAKQRHLDLSELKLLWSCPSKKKRISLPDQRDQAKAERFRSGKGFLFFQHLRKAGGTNFCTLAQDNLPKVALPPYFCMPDYYWHRDQDGQDKSCAGCLHQWTNEEITNNMKYHRIAGNEWDSFDPARHFDLDAVFVTSFRKV